MRVVQTHVHAGPGCDSQQDLSLARTNKPIAQLAIYALVLTRLVPGLKLFDIKCAVL